MSSSMSSSALGGTSSSLSSSLSSSSSSSSSGLGVVDTAVVNYESCLEFLDDSARLTLPLIPPAFAEAFMLSHLGCGNTDKDGGNGSDEMLLHNDDDDGDFAAMDVETDNWDQWNGIDDILSKDIDIEALDIFNGSKVDSDKSEGIDMRLDGEGEDSGLDSEVASTGSGQDTTHTDTTDTALDYSMRNTGNTHEDEDITVKLEDVAVNLTTNNITSQSQGLLQRIIIKPEQMDVKVKEEIKFEIKNVPDVKQEVEDDAPVIKQARFSNPPTPVVVKPEASLANKLSLTCSCAKCTKALHNKAAAAARSPAQPTITATTPMFYIPNSSSISSAITGRASKGAVSTTATRLSACHADVNPTVQALLSAAAAANAMLSKQKQQQQQQLQQQQGTSSSTSVVIMPTTSPAKSTPPAPTKAVVTTTPAKPSSTVVNTTKTTAKSKVNIEEIEETSASATSPVSDLTCVACTKTFSRRYNLRRHQMSLGHWAPISHPNPITFKSTRLEQSMPAEQAAPRREEIHDDEKPFLCTACSMRFTLKSSLRRHQIKFNHVNQPAASVGSEGSDTATAAETSMSESASSPVSSSPAHSPTILHNHARGSASSFIPVPAASNTIISTAPPHSFTLATLASSSHTAKMINTPAPISATIPPPLTLSQPSVRPNPDLVAIATPSPITVAKAGMGQLTHRPFTISASPSAISALTIATPPPMMTTTLTPPSTPPQPVQPSASPQPLTPSTISLMIIPYLKMKGCQPIVSIAGNDHSSLRFSSGASGANLGAHSSSSSSSK